MKIALGEIVHEKKKYSIKENSWFPEDEYDLEETNKAVLNLYRQDKNNVLVDGELDCSVRVSCDRCGEKFGIQITSNFNYRVRNETDKSLELQEMELSDEDCNTIYLQEPVLDLGEILHEQLFLNMPQSRVCSEDCKGLCLKCGRSIDDATGCNCNNVDVTSPFAVLEKLKK